MVNKNLIAQILDECGTLLSIKGENDFRCRAYHNAAQAIEQYEGDLGDAIAQNKLGEIRGIGDTMKAKIIEIAETGKLMFHEKLREEVPDGIVQMLRIPGLAQKKIKALRDELNITSIADLQAACERGDVAKLKGFGAKTQAKILEGIAFVDKMGNRQLLPDAEEAAAPLLTLVRATPGVQRSELCGSLRRRRETVADIDVLASAKDPDKVLDAFVQAPNVRQVLGRGPTKASVMLTNGVQADLRVVDDASFPFALHYFTGNKDHNITMRQRAIDRGLKLNEYSLEGVENGKKLPAKDEKDLFCLLDLDFIPPEMRENTGEIQASSGHQLPDLISLDDLVGTFHCHTTYSDGKNSVEEMALAAKKLGLKYLGIADHSQSLAFTGGLTPARIRVQHKEIDAINDKLTGMRVLKGTECDILSDGRLDYEDDVLASFDYVVASVHSHFNQTREEMTERIIKAILNPYVSILGHATGRILLRRDSYSLDVDAVLKVAAETGTVIEINAHPNRLDLDWLHVKRGKGLGVRFAINPDAHRTEEIGLLKYGIDVARRGWLTKEDVVNTRPWPAVKKLFKQP
jgi:DNA polymerase (family 10)